MAGEIGIVADDVLPKPPLPEGVFTAGVAFQADTALKQ